MWQYNDPCLRITYFQQLSADGLSLSVPSFTPPFLTLDILKQIPQIIRFHLHIFQCFCKMVILET